MDAGVTPRLEGVRHIIASNEDVDYVVFWDDDNTYPRDALARIVEAVDKAERPDLLVARVRYTGNLIPPIDSDVHSLNVGEVDTACMVFRPRLAERTYAAVKKHDKLEEILSINDFLVYDNINKLRPTILMKFDPSVVICQHDGLRWGPFLRSMLGIPPLGLGRLIGMGR
jgi:hypothetical protein